MNMLDFFRDNTQIFTDAIQVMNNIIADIQV
ncbi:hypothetical protein SDC9_65485 [bioreactor metagenome]|uniref:Uncharacterized protein n=1 Tax=bioreactor metagenome TaxID=1076179 RepID=A0A644XT29_9ZZZZ